MSLNKSRATGEIDIRSFEPGDLEQAVAIWHRSKKKAFPYVDVQQRYTLEDDRNYFENEITPGRDVWVAERAGRIVGFIALQGELIDQLFVDVNAQNQRVGSALVDKAKTLHPNRLRAYTFQKNEAARSFFEKHGFTVIGLGTSPPPESEPDVEYEWVA